MSFIEFVQPYCVVLRDLKRGKRQHSRQNFRTRPRAYNYSSNRSRSTVVLNLKFPILSVRRKSTKCKPLTFYRLAPCLCGHLSDIFGVSEEPVSKVLTTWVCFLSAVFHDSLLKWPCKEDIKKTSPRLVF